MHYALDFIAKVHGQRWLFRIGNAEVIADNAFSWLGWGQERWLINGVLVRETRGWFALERSFSEPWVTSFGEGTFAANLKLRAASVECFVTVNGERQNHDALFEACWSERGARPSAEDWVEVTSFSIFRFLRSRRGLEIKSPTV